MNELTTTVTESAAIDNLKTVISKIMEQNDDLNAKIAVLQSSIDVCKDSIAALNTIIAQSNNYMGMLLSTPYGVMIVGIVMIVIGIIAMKKGIKLSKNGTTIAIGKDSEEDK